MSDGWEVVPQIGYVVNVMPINDSDGVFQHDLDETCICGPRIEPVPRDDGSMGWLYTHHSLDGREAEEPR